MSAYHADRFAPLPFFAGAGLAQLKWVGLALMVVDHVEAFWFQRSFDSQLGRLVFPIFAFVIGYNLARPNVDRVTLFFRLCVFGLLAMLPHAVLIGAWFPANVMFTFAAAVLVVHLLASKKPERILSAFVVFVLAGAFVEYWWPGIALVVGVATVFRSPVLSRCGASFIGGESARTNEGIQRWWPVWVPLGFLCLLQGSAVPLLAAPLVWCWRGDAYVVPRGKWVFYWFYPLHLLAFVLLDAPGLRG